MYTLPILFNALPGQKNTKYDLYTFLHDTSGIIHLKVTAYDSADNIQHEWEFDVPMTQNKITWLSGEFYTGYSSNIPDLHHHCYYQHHLGR